MKNRLLVCLLAFRLVVAASTSDAATGCVYPTSLDTYVDKQAGDFLTVADVNRIMCAAEKIEAELGTNPKGNYATVAGRLDSLIDSAGKSGGQTVIGGTGVGESLTLQSTTSATRGLLKLGSATALGASSAYDETNVRLGIGTQAPTADISIAKNTNAGMQINTAGTSIYPYLRGVNARGTLLSPTATQANDVLIRVEGSGYDTAYTPTVGTIGINAKENFTASARGTYAQILLTSAGSTTPIESVVVDTTGVRVGGGGFPDTSLHLALNAGNTAAITLVESAATPPAPNASGAPLSGTDARIYLKADKLIIAFNDAGTVRYKYLDLTGVGTSWVHTTTAP
jgi:hypothetical protein